MKFSTAKNTALAFLLASMGIGLVGAFALDEGSSEYLMTVYATVALLAIALAIIFIWCKCPKCGKRIFYQLFKYKKCPKCGAVLEGKDSSKKESKKNNSSNYAKRLR